MTATGARDPAAQRILVVLHDLGPGGTERVAIRLANAWSRLGRDVTLLCGDARGPAARLVGPGVNLVACDPAIPRGPGSRSRLGRATARHLAACAADLLFVPGNHHWPIIPAVARSPAASRPRIVAQISNPLRRRDRGWLRQAWFEGRTRRLLAGADATVSLTAAGVGEADDVLRRAVTSHIPLPVLDDPPRPPLAPGRGPPLILCLGRLVPQKGLDDALRAFARLETPGARLAIAGTGPLRARLQRLAETLKIADRVAWPGHVDNVRIWLDRCSLLLVPSRFEGYAAVVVEALAAGRPVVATDAVPAALELVTTPSRGRVTPAGDLAALGEAVAQVLAQEAGDACELTASVAGFALQQIAPVYLRLFDAVTVAAGMA